MLGLLCGCEAGEESVQSALDFRTKLLEAGLCTFQMDVQVNYGEETAAFSMDCAYDTAGTAQMELTAPETLRGIRAAAEKENVDLEFEDVRLALADIADGQLAPMAAARLLGGCWQEGYISCVSSENGGSRVTYLYGYDREELTVDCWFSADGCPVHAEVSKNGSMVLRADISEFQFQKEQT